MYDLPDTQRYVDIQGHVIPAGLSAAGNTWSSLQVSHRQATLGH